jgi:serine/threonine protein kinase
MRRDLELVVLNLLCPACHTPLPAGAAQVVTCATCDAEVDVARAGTLAGRPRFVPEIDRTGTTVGGYRIEARLGGGGMGTVYRATDATGERAAVKFLSTTLASNPDVVARFAREIEVLTRLEHPAIVRVREHGTDDGIPWFAMALVDGTDLRARLAAGALPPAEAAAVFERLFAALAHAHARGVVHRDLKPANVLLAPDGARLADFEIARFEAELAASARVTRLTETAAVIGTLPYMSPEQRRGGAVDRRSDLFSAGVMLYEAATGSLPQGAFAPPSEINGAYGKAFDRLVMQLLQAEPARRPASADEAGALLRGALAPRGRRPLAVGATAAALGALLVGGGLGGRALLRGPAWVGDKAQAAAPPVAPAKVAAPIAPTTAPTAPTAPSTAKKAVAEPVPAVPKTKSLLNKWKRKVVLEALQNAAKTPPPEMTQAKLATFPDAQPGEVDKKAGVPRVGADTKAGKPRPKKALPDDVDFSEVEEGVKDGVPPIKNGLRDKKTGKPPAPDVPQVQRK